MGRDPDKTERIVIWTTPEQKAEWEAWRTFFDDNPAALAQLLEMKDVVPEARDDIEILEQMRDVAESNPELMGGYFS